MTEILAFLIIFVAMLLRTITGFGSALVAIPLLSLLYGAKFAVPFIMLYECLIDIMILGKDGLKSNGELKQALPFVLAGLIGVPLGAQVLIASSEWLMKMLMGIALIFFSLLLLWNVISSSREIGSDLHFQALWEDFFAGALECRVHPWRCS